MAVQKWDHSVICLLLLTGLSVEGACPNDVTPVIDLCGNSTFTGLGAYIDAAGMADGHSSCSCSLTSAAPQEVMYVSMMLSQRRTCQNYDYNIFRTLDNQADTWTCGSPEGYGFTNTRLDSKYPWLVSINKTQAGIVSAPPEDPGYCVIFVAVNNQPISIVCGNETVTTSTAETSSTATVPTTTPATTTPIITITELITSTLNISVSTSSDQVTTARISSAATTQSDSTTSASPITATTEYTGTSSDTSTGVETQTFVDTSSPGGTTSSPGGTTSSPAGTTSSPAGTTSSPGDTTSSDNTSAVVTTTAASPGSASTTSTEISPGRFEESGNVDTGVGVIIGGILAALTLFFLVALACYFCNRRSKRKEDEFDRNSIDTSTTNVAGYPYRQPGDGYVYYLDTSAVSNKDYIYLWSE